MTHEDNGSAAPLLRCAGVAKAFAGVRALKDVSVHVAAGGIASLIGPNGAGKTTLFNCLAGFVRPDAGEIWFRERRIDGRRAQVVSRAGLVRTFQSIRMFPGLTVLESVLAAQYARRRDGRHRPLAPLRRREEGVRRADEILLLLGLEEARNTRCTDLPLLAQRKVELARAVACEPLLLLLDEPSAGATPAEAHELARVIGELRARGMTIFVIEHNVPFVMEISQSIWVMNFGEIVAHGVPDAISKMEIVQEIYLGT